MVKNSCQFIAQFPQLVGLRARILNLAPFEFVNSILCIIHCYENWELDNFSFNFSTNIYEACYGSGSMLATRDTAGNKTDVVSTLQNKSANFHQSLR